MRARSTFLMAAALSLTACGTLPVDSFDNRVSCTPAGDRAFVVSLWRFFGIATDLSPKDAPAVCRKLSL